MKQCYLMLIASLILFQVNHSYAVHPTPTDTRIEETKFEKQKKKWEKKLEKWTAQEDGLIDKPRPWVALAFALGGLFGFILGFLASFGLLGLLAALAFSGGLALCAIGFLVAVGSLNRRSEAKKPKLTGFISALALIISGLTGAILIFILIGGLINFLSRFI